MSEPEYAAAGGHDIEQLAATVRQASSSDAPRILIGIDGPGASGKSTLATLLATALGGAEVVHGDDFYRPSATRPEGDAEAGGQFDLERLLHQVVAPAAAGKEITYQIYDWDRDELGPWVSVPEGSPLIVEGVYTTELRLRDHYTYRIFCLADRDVRLNRGLARDGESSRSRPLRAGRSGPWAPGGLVGGVFRGEYVARVAALVSGWRPGGRRSRSVGQSPA